MSRDEQKNHRRKRIINAAEDLFLSCGLAASGMPDIAERSGLNVRTLYRYYKTKEELAFEIEIRIFENMIEKLKSASEIIEDGSGFEKISELLALMENYYRFSEDEIRFMGEFDHYFTGAYPYSELADRFVAMLRAMENPLRNFLEEGISDGSVRDDLDVDLTVGTIENALLALAQRIVTRGEHLEQEQRVNPSAMLPALVQLLLNGIEHK